MNSKYCVAMNFFTVYGKRTFFVVAAAAAAATATAAAIGLYKRHKARQAVLEQQRKKQNAFENRFLKEYDELADDPAAPIPAAHVHVRETTPQGDVIMTYDADRAMFCYYCDKRSVQFKYLEPIARKYVIEHGCKRLYIDIRKEMAKAGETAATAPVIAKTVKPDSVFAKLKKYGSKPTNPIPLKEQVTRYWYCGNLNEFNDSAQDSPQDPAQDFSIIKPIDYASYKKMNSP
jgi:hypothetical protein